MAGSDEASPVVGVDLGGTKVLAGVVSSDHRILSRAKRPTPAQEGGEAILRAIAEAVTEALTIARLKAADIVGVGVGSPGPLDAERGIILFSANMAVRNFALGPDLRPSISTSRCWSRTTCASAATASTGWVPAAVTRTWWRPSWARASAAA